MLLRALGVALFFLTTLFITNNFDPEIVGKYDFSRSLLIFLGTVTLFGMQSSIIYYSGYLLSKHSLGLIKQIYAKMVAIILGLSLLILVAAYVGNIETVREILPIPINDTALQTILLLFFYSLTMLNIEGFRAVERIYLSEIHRNILRYLLFFAGVLMIYFMGAQEQLVSVFLANFVVLAVISSILLYISFPKDKPAEKVRVKYREIIGRSAPMAVSAAAFMLIQSLDVLMLSYLTDYETVAYYSAAVKLTLLVFLVLSSVNAVLAPKIAELYEADNIAGLKQNIRNGTRLIFIMTFPVIVVLGLLAMFLLGFFGENYDSSATSLRILLAGQLINALCGSVGVYLNMTRKQKAFQFILISALVINVILNYILIPRYGMIGAAIATSACVILWNLTAVIYVYQVDRIKIFLTLR